MKHWRLFVIIGLLAAWWLVLQRCHGQQPFHNSQAWRAQQWVHSAASSVPTPSVQPGIFDWWVSSDMPTNVLATNWVGRVNAIQWTNTAAQSPTNSATGVGFDSTKRLHFAWPFVLPTDTAGRTSVVFCVITPVGPGAAANAMFIAGANGDRGYAMATGPKAHLYGVANSIDLFNSTQTRIDVVGLHYRSGYDVVYTNGVLANRGTTTTTCGIDNLTDLGYSVNGSRGWVGWMEEFAICTNTGSWTESMVVSNFHKYATNIYKFSP